MSGAAVHLQMHLNMEFADGSTRDVVVASEELAGAVLSPIAELASASSARILVPELASAKQARPLIDFLRSGRIDDAYSAVDSDLVACYLAASERLDIQEFVLAAEKHVLSRLKDGRASIDEIAKAYAVCPRVLALCTHYVELRGFQPPPFNPIDYIDEYVSDHGVLLVVTKKGCYEKSSFYIVADVERCAEMAEGHKLCSEIVGVHSEPSVSPNRDGDYVIFSGTIGLHPRLDPKDSETWVDNIYPHFYRTCRAEELASLLQHDKDSPITLISSMSGDLLFSRDPTSTALHEHRVCD